MTTALLARTLEIAAEQHPAGGALLAVAFDEAQDLDVRRRALEAWDVLNVPGPPARLALPPVGVPEGLGGAAAGVGALVVNVIYSGSRLERERSARLLANVCREAAAQARGRAAA